MQPLIFGSMRMTEKTESIKYWVELFCYLYDNNIVTHHVSSEYDSFDLYRKVYHVFSKTYPQKKIHHICKIGEPSFDDGMYSGSRLRAKCIEYLRVLEVDDITVQWMSRFSLPNSVKRRKHLKLVLSNLESSMIRLKDEGIVKRYYVFPYSENELEIYLKSPAWNPNGFITYCNLQETSYAVILNKYLSRGNIAIRPFKGKEVISAFSVQEAIDFVIKNGAYNQIVVSFSNKNQIDEVLSYIG